VSEERWLPVVGWEGHYEVSDKGRVRRVKPAFGTRPGKVLRPGLCRGYPIVGLCRDGVTSSQRVHRLVAAAFIGPPPARGMHVDHRDGDRCNAQVDNLEYVTAAENNRRALERTPRSQRVYPPARPRIEFEPVSEEEKAHLRATWKREQQSKQSQ